MRTVLAFAVSLRVSIVDHTFKNENNTKQQNYTKQMTTIYYLQQHN